MTDTLGERITAANPVPLSALGDLHGAFAHKLVDDITGRRTPARRSRKRRLAVALLVALAVAAPVALAAARTDLLEFALGDPPPKDAQAQLDSMIPPDYGPKEGPPQWASRKDIVGGSQRLVAQMTTSTGAVARMYAVELRGGGACWFAEGKPFGTGGCGGRVLERQSVIGGTVGMLFAGMGKREPGTFGQGVTYLGRVGARAATSLRIEFKDGSADSISLHDGWFMYEVPVAQTHWGHEPVRAEALDAHGRALSSVEDPLGLHPPAQPKPEHALERRELLARLPLGWHGASLELWLAKGSKGNDCIQVRNTANRHTERWLCGPAVGRDAAGRVVYRTFLYPAARCAYPVRDTRCSDTVFNNG